MSYSSDSTAQPPVQICVLGGGFGGLYTALRLSQLPWHDRLPEIVLVDQRDRFVFAPLLYELMTGELQAWEVAPTYSELLAGTNIRFCQSQIAAINPDAQQVRLESGSMLTYDRLVIALGGETPMDRVPGCADHALPFRTLQDAIRLEDRLRVLETSHADKLRIAIVGAGYSGVELACKLADRLGNRARIRLVEQGNRILANSPEFNQKAAQNALSARNIWIDLETTPASITADAIALTYKEQTDTIPVDLVLWTVGTQVADVVRSLPLKKNARDQLVVTPTLQVVDAPHIFALGDGAACQDATGQTVPTTAQVAFQQADYAGWNVWASLDDRPLLPFRYQPLGEMMALGKDDATLTGLGLQMQGSLAHLARRLAYLYRMPTLEHQVRVGLNWMTRPIADGLQQTFKPWLS